MKRKILLGSTLVVLAGLILIGMSSCQANSEARLITVLNPAISQNIAERVPLTPRLDTLEGKTIYLYDTEWGGPEAANSVYEEMQAWFAKNIPSANVVIQKGSGWMSYDKGFLQVVKDKKVDAVLIGISG
ncbi:MAG: hypothetical protein FWF13_04310 [Acidobacteria bacterium]|nr:hypothetical protein [Acidobacteriota bacterium]